MGTKVFASKANNFEFIALPWFLMNFEKFLLKAAALLCSKTLSIAGKANGLSKEVSDKTPLIGNLKSKLSRMI